jgi:hypothetical protein
MTQYTSNDVMLEDNQQDFCSDIFEQNATNRYSRKRTLLLFLFVYFLSLSYFLYWCFS